MTAPPRRCAFGWAFERGRPAAHTDRDGAGQRHAAGVRRRPYTAATYRVPSLGRLVLFVRASPVPSVTKKNQLSGLSRLSLDHSGGCPCRLVPRTGPSICLYTPPCPWDRLSLREELVFLFSVGFSLPLCVYGRKVKNSQSGSATGYQRGMGGRETDDDDTLERCLLWPRLRRSEY